MRNLFNELPHVVLKLGKINEQACVLSISLFLIQVKALLPTEAELLASEELLVVLKGWVLDDSCISTIGVERAHRQNADVLAARRGVKLDLHRFQSTAYLHAHRLAHKQRGGQPLEDLIQQRRLLAAVKHKAASAAPGSCKKKGMTRNKGSGMIAFCASKVAEHKALHPQRLPASDLHGLRKAAAAEWRTLSADQQRDFKDEVCASYVKRRLQPYLDAQTTSDSDDCDSFRNSEPFCFGDREWPLTVERLQTDFASTYGCKVSEHLSGGVVRAAQLIVSNELNSPFINDRADLIPAKIVPELTCYDSHPGLCATEHADILEAARDISLALAEFIKAGSCKPGRTLVAMMGRVSEQPTVAFCAMLSYHLKSPDKIGWAMMSFEPCPVTFLPFDAQPSSVTDAFRLSALASHTHHGLASLLARRAIGKPGFTWTIQKVKYVHVAVGKFGCRSFEGDPFTLCGVAESTVAQSSGKAKGIKLARDSASDDEDISSWKAAIATKKDNAGKTASKVNMKPSPAEGLSSCVV